jgi:hypothetical protein
MGATKGSGAPEVPNTARIFARGAGIGATAADEYVSIT